MIIDRAKKLTGGTVGLILLVWLARSWYHGGQESAAVAEPTPTPTEQVAPPPTPPSAVSPDSDFRDDANRATDFLIRYLKGRAWELSKLPVDELNAICWEYRPQTQAIKDQFDNSTFLEPSQFEGHEGVVLGDITCKLARHYQTTDDSPEYAKLDISVLEGMGDEPTE